MIKIFEGNEKSFTTNGLGTIQPLKCIETKKISLNGWYIEVEVPVQCADLIQQDRIVLVQTKEKGEQAFRIQNPVKKDRKISFTADHIIFDADHYMLEDVRPEHLSPVAYLTWCNDRTDTVSPFRIGGTATGFGTNYFIRKSLLYAFQQAEETFQTYYDVDNYNIRIMDMIGNDNGFSVAYGKNIQGITISEDWSEVCTKLLPVGSDELMLPEIYLTADVQYVKPYTRTVEFTVEDKDENDVEYTEEQKQASLREQALAYLEEHKYPKVAYEVKSDVPQELCMNDVVHIKHPLCDIAANVQEYRYDCESGRVKSLVFGNYDTDVKTMFQGSLDALKNQNEKQLSVALQMIAHQTDLINRLNKTGYVYMNENEIFILDQLPLEEAKQVWRFGLGGLGFSNNGYQGPFEYALTQDGKFNVDFIVAGSITTSLLSTDAIKSLNYKADENGSYLNLEDGSFDSRYLKWDSEGNVTANSLQSNNARITGGDVTLESQAQNESHLRLVREGYSESSFAPEGVTMVQQNGTGCRVAPGSTAFDSLYVSSDANGEGVMHNYTTVLKDDSLIEDITTNVEPTIISDASMKKDISTLLPEDAAEFIMGLRPVQYKLRDGTSGRFHHGLIAGEVRDAMKTDWGLYVDASVKYPDAAGGNSALRYGELIADMIAAQQHLNIRLNRLEEMLHADAD